MLYEFPRSERATVWQLKSYTLKLPPRPLIMGIVNVTPDSFSDGGRHNNTERAIDHALRLIAEGADIVDVGGESTRPYSTPVSVSEERRRVVDVVRGIAELTAVPISIDTSKASIARECIDAGAEIINDVTAFTGDTDMLPFAVESQVGVCAMHMQGTPATMQDNPTYEDVVEDILGYLQQRRDALEKAGVDPKRVCLDPGIGFGKSHADNIALVSQAKRLHALERPILVGHSRKGFLAKILGDRDQSRDVATAAVAISLAQQGVQIVRVHDVGVVRDALVTYEAIGGFDERPE